MMPEEWMNVALIAVGLSGQYIAACMGYIKTLIVCNLIVLIGAGSFLLNQFFGINL